MIRGRQVKGMPVMRKKLRSQVGNFRNTWRAFSFNYIPLVENHYCINSLPVMEVCCIFQGCWARMKTENQYCKVMLYKDWSDGLTE